MKVLTIVGARPQFIKASVVSKAFVVAGVDECLVHTGQHYDENMSAAFFDELGIPTPKVNLHIGSGGHGLQTGRMMEALEGCILDEHPDWILVYGDTNSTLAGALVGAKLHVPVAHVEAGLRSFDRKMPEEVNRVVTDHVSRLLFVPTAAAMDNLAREGITGDMVLRSGDVMFDVALHYASKADRESKLLSRLGLSSGEYVVATVHRAENTDNLDTLRSIVDGLLAVAESRPVLLPLHPRTAASLSASGMRERMEAGLLVTEPLGYLDMLQAVKHAAVVVTDSGGLQKEAFFQRRPCVTLRTTTEWIELLETGWNRLVPPTDGESIVKAVDAAWGSAGTETDVYGDGRAAELIVRSLTELDAR